MFADNLFHLFRGEISDLGTWISGFSFGAGGGESRGRGRWRGNGDGAQLRKTPSVGQDFWKLFGKRHKKGERDRKRPVQPFCSSTQGCLQAQGRYGCKSKKIWVGRSQVQNSVQTRTVRSGVSIKNVPYLLRFIHTISIHVWDALVDCTFALHVRDATHELNK